MNDNANPYTLPSIPPEQKAVPANRLETETAINEALKAGDFDRRVEAAMKAGDHNLAERIIHARAQRDYEQASEQLGNIQGEIAAAEARMKFAKDDAAKDKLREQIASLKSKLSDLNTTLKLAGDAVSRGPTIIRRGAEADTSDAAEHVAYAAVQVGPFKQYQRLPVKARGVRATLNALQEMGLDPSAEVVIESTSQGWRYAVEANEFGDFTVKLLDGRGRRRALRCLEGDGTPPVAEHGEPVAHSAEAFYGGRKLPLFDARTPRERQDDAFDRSMGRTPSRDLNDLFRRAFIEQGVRVVRRK